MLGFYSGSDRTCGGVSRREILRIGGISGLGLSLATLCFSLYGHDVAAWRTLLARHYEQTGFLGETKTLALALLALGDGSRVFRITAHA